MEDEQKKFEEEVLGESTPVPDIKIPAVENIDLSLLRVDGNNPNSMTQTQKDALWENMKKFGVIVPIITNNDYMIADGQNRWEILLEHGIQKGPVIKLPIDEVDRRILRQVLNKLKGQHDSILDENEFKFILKNDRFEEFQALLGDSDKQLVQFLASIDKNRVEDQDFDSEASARNPKYTVFPGDIWELGDHQLMCGDSTKKEDVSKLMNGAKANMAFTDPPYNVNYDQDKSPLGKPSDSKGKILNDCMPRQEFKKFLEQAFENLLNNTKGAIYICMGCKEWPTAMSAFEEKGGHWSSTIIWNKNSFVKSRQDYHSKFEPMIYGWKEGNEHYFIPNRTLSDVWNLNRPAKNEWHPTQKPVELPAEAIVNSSQEKDLVLDLFGGSGSTLIACEQTKRKCLIMEIDPRFCSAIIERWEQVTGQKAKK